MKDNNLLQRIAKLESINDQLFAELNYIDDISRKLGFCDGLATLKEAAIELLEIEREKEANSEGEANQDPSKS